MSTPRWTDEHARLVSLAEPDVAPASGDELARGWRRVEHELARPERPRRRGVRATVGAVVAAVVLGAGGMAAAGVFTAHTGRYPTDAEELRLGGPGERLDPAAPDYGSVIDAVTADIPFPSGRSRAIARQDEVRDGRRDAPGTSAVSTGALRFWTARAAVCAWSNVWAAPDGVVSPEARARAASALTEAPSWRAVTDVDALQSATSQTEAAFFPQVRDAVLVGDATALASVLARRGACSAALLPDFPQALGTR